MNFWDSNVWGSVLLFCVLLGAMMIANMLKKWIRPLEYSLIWNGRHDPAARLGCLQVDHGG